MSNMMKKILTLAVLSTVLIGSFLLSQKPVLSAVRCETQYGGEEVCVKIGELYIDKKVKNPETGLLVDNLFLGDPKFAPGQEVVFKLTIKNTGHEKFDKVHVRDVLPEFVEFVSGPGSYNSTLREVTFDIDDLDPDETSEFEIKAKVVNADKLPANKDLICVVNYAEVKNENESDKDTSQVCLEKKILGVVEIPVTGPDNWLIFSSLALLTALSGLALIRLARYLD